MCRRILITFVDTFVLRMFHFGGQWFITLKRIGSSKNTEGLTALKGKGGSWAVAIYLQRGSALPPCWNLLEMETKNFILVVLL